MDQPTRITFVRHGLVANPQQVLYGRLPRFALSQTGQQQAQQTGRFLGDRRVHRIFSSPLLRARQTAGAILHHHPRLRLHISRLLHEVYTPYQGCPVAQTDCLCGDFYADAGASFEQPEDVLDRVLRFARRCCRRHSGHHLVAVTHGDPIAFLAMWAHGTPLDPKRKATLAPLGIAAGYPQPGSASTFEWPGKAESPPILVNHWRP